MLQSDLIETFLVRVSWGQGWPVHKLFQALWSFQARFAPGLNNWMYPILGYSLLLPPKVGPLGTPYTLACRPHYRPPGNDFGM